MKGVLIMALSISKKGLALIKEFEGCVLTAYRCPAGVLTIGYGHTSGVKSGMVITEAMAEKYLIEDCKWAENAVNAWAAKYNWNQNQFDSLVSFTFNCGAGNLETLLAGGKRSIAEISEKILLYNKANGETLAGLVRRREAEKALFDTKCSESVTKPAKTETKTEKAKQGACKVELPVLRKGAKGQSVVALQSILILAGFNCGGYGADGDFGTGTEKSVKAYQQHYGLAVDGIVGQATWTKLLK